jgi:hypothetical protein
MMHKETSRELCSPESIKKGDILMQVYLRYIGSTSSGQSLVYGEYVNSFEIVPIGKEFALTFFGQKEIRAIMSISMLKEVFNNVDMVFTGDLPTYSLPGNGPQIDILVIQ